MYRSLFLVFILSSACLGPYNNTDSDATIASTDAAVMDSNSTPDAFRPWELTFFGKPCVDDSECTSEGACLSIFSSGAGSTCWKKCASMDDCADFPYDSADLTCASFGGHANVCIAVSAENGPCGNGINATCGDPDYQFCPVEDYTSFDFCMRLCSLSDPTNSSACAADGVPASMCGCQDGDSCSTMRVFANEQHEVAYGVCSPTSQIGDSCGIDPDTFVAYMCTGNQACDGWDDDNLGNCVAADAGFVDASVDDAASGEDA